MAENDQSTASAPEPGSGGGAPARLAAPAAATGTSTAGTTLPAAPAAPPAGMAADTHLGPVRLLEEIGRGGMGIVYRGHHTLLGRDVAVKVLGRAFASADDPACQRFRAEVRAAAAVRHPHLVEVLHADQVAGVPYIVMTYVAGPTLKRLLAQAGPLSLPAAVMVLDDLAPALDELHRHDLVHRDIKPANILLDREAEAYLSDFGLAFRRPEDQVGPAHVGAAGTPAYMAPEMFDGQASARSDLYSLGIVLFEVLAGTLPFRGGWDELARQHAQAALPMDALRARGVSDAVIAVIERAAHKRALYRYKTAEDLLRELRQAGGTLGPVAKTRRQLAGLVASSAGGAAVADAGGAGGSSGSGGSGSSGGGADTPRRPETLTVTSGAELLTRLAASKRDERRRAGTDAPPPNPLLEVPAPELPARGSTTSPSAAPSSAAGSTAPAHPAGPDAAPSAAPGAPAPADSASAAPGALPRAARLLPPPEPPAPIVPPGWLAGVSLGLGLAGLLCWCYPPVGLLLTIPGLICGLIARHSPRRRLAAVGVALCGIGLVLTILSGTVGAFTDLPLWVHWDAQGFHFGAR